MKEVRLGQIIGPFLVQPLNPVICLPVGMVNKQDSQEMRCITHLSHPRGRSINAFIDPEDAQTHYQSFEAAVELVARAGQGSYMAKEDFKSAFCNVPMCLQTIIFWVSRSEVNFLLIIAFLSEHQFHVPYLRILLHLYIG